MVMVIYLNRLEFVIEVILAHSSTAKKWNEPMFKSILLPIKVTRTWEFENLQMQILEDFLNNGTFGIHLCLANC